MHLSKAEEQMLSGECGVVPQRMMCLLVRLGEIYGAQGMMPVASVQVSGVSYKSIADPGTEFLEDLAAKGGRAKVLTFLNPAGMDIECWKEMGIPEAFAKNQMRIMDAFEKMGIITSATCTPYLAGNLPKFGEHIAWSESSAVSFSNSVIGARTNREGGPSALAAAICGVTPNYGLHLDENRKPEFIIEVGSHLSGSADFGALGHYVGKAVKNKNPYFKGIKSATVDELKGLGGAMAASGAVAMYQVEGLTPEAAVWEEKAKAAKGLEKIPVGKKELDESRAKLNTGDKFDIAILGCPHASLQEIMEVAQKVKGKKLQKPLWICTARTTRCLARRAGLVDIIEQAGGSVVADTCMVVAPIEDMGYETTAVNSGKAAAYMPGFCKQKVVFKSTDEIIRGLTE